MSIAWNAFAPASALMGGAMIGAAAALFVVLNGRIAGVSGILGGLARPQAGDVSWRIAFVAGLVAAPLAWRVLAALPEIRVDARFPPLAAPRPPGGVGTRYGGGGDGRGGGGGGGGFGGEGEENLDAARCAGAAPERAPHRQAGHLRQPGVRRRLGTGRHLPGTRAGSGRNGFGEGPCLSRRDDRRQRGIRILREEKTRFAPPPAPARLPTHSHPQNPTQI